MPHPDTSYLQAVAALLHDDLRTFRADEAERRSCECPATPEALAAHFCPTHFNLRFLFSLVGQKPRKALWLKALSKGVNKNDTRELLASFLGLGCWSRITNDEARAFLRQLFEHEAENSPHCDFRRWREIAIHEKDRHHGRMTADFWTYVAEEPVADRVTEDDRLSLPGSLLRDSSGFSRKFPKTAEKPEETQVDWKGDFVSF